MKSPQKNGGWTTVSFSFWEGLFSRAMFVSGRVYIYIHIYIEYIYIFMHAFVLPRAVFAGLRRSNL